jgi:hypothetical protein
MPSRKALQKIQRATPGDCMDALFNELPLRDWHGDLFRNIVSLRHSENLFDDLSTAPAAQAMALQLELRFKPLTFESSQPIIDRPFEEATYDEAIGYPFTHWCESRYSDGRFGVWYGTDALITSIHETVYHWRQGFLADAGWENIEVSIERRVHWVRCDVALINLQTRVLDYPSLIDPHSYHFTQAIGRRLHHEGHPGLLTQSARCDGAVFALFTPRVLSNPRVQFYLTYRIAGERVEIRRQEGEVMMSL